MRAFSAGCQMKGKMSIAHFTLHLYWAKMNILPVPSSCPHWSQCSVSWWGIGMPGIKLPKVWSDLYSTLSCQTSTLLPPRSTSWAGADSDISTSAKVFTCNIFSSCERSECAVWRRMKKSLKIKVKNCFSTDHLPHIWKMKPLSRYWLSHKPNK